MRRQEPYSYKAYDKYRKAHEEWPNRLYTSTRKQVLTLLALLVQQYKY